LSEIDSWFAWSDQERNGNFGHKEKMLLKLSFLIYDISSWIKRSLLNEVSLTVQEFRKALSTGRGFYFLEGDKLPRSLYVWVSLIEDRKKTEEMAERVRALVPQTLRLR
jgi:hypothetical protein